MSMSPRLLRPRQTGFNPRSIASLEFWLDAADQSNIVTDGSPARVSTWRDKSGFGRHATNSVSGSTQPLYVSHAVKGRNVVRYSTSDNSVLTVENSTGMFNFLHDGTKSMVFYAGRIGDVSDPNAAYTLFSNFNTVPGSGRGFLMYYEDRVSQSGNNSLAIRMSNGSGQPVAYTPSALFTPNAPFVLGVTLDASNATVDDRVEVTLNGGSALKGNNSNVAPATGNAVNNMLIGRLVQFALSMQGDIYEILMYSQIASAQQRLAITNYLRAKWT